MTYIYRDKKSLVSNSLADTGRLFVCQHGHGCDMPNLVHGDTGERIYGTDYYQSMMLLALRLLFSSIRTSPQELAPVRAWSAASSTLVENPNLNSRPRPRSEPRSGYDKTVDWGA